MRIALVVLALLVALASVADAQGPPPTGATPCGRGSGDFRGGPRGNLTRNFTRGNDSIEGLNVTLDPAGPVALSPGKSALVTIALRNDGNATLDLTFAAPALGRNNTTPPVTATLSPEQGTLAPGDTGSVQVALTAANDAPTGCVANAIVLVRDAASNRTTFVRIEASLTAPSSGASGAPATGSPVAASTSGNVASKASPGTQVAGVVLAMLGGALLLRRR